MKQGIIGSLLAVLFDFCLLPSVANTWTPQDFVRLVKTVEVKGEVAAPGVYEVAWDADVETILAAAGGAGEEADLSGIRLSQIVANESVIVIPKKSEQPKISINSASLEELDTLDGIGPAIAQRIIDYREEHPFSSLEELKNVKGIGDKLYDKIKDSITL